MKSTATAKSVFLAENLKQGEAYAGIVLGTDGEPDYHLFKLPGEIERATFQDAIDWAKSVGGESPNRRELALLRVNARECFKDTIYWSGEQHAAYSNYAWCQYFSNGYQYNYYKDDKFRGVAVRRLAILQFNYLGLKGMLKMHKSLRHESKKLKYSARGMNCMVRIPGVCNFNSETTVLAHINGGGMGTKQSDLFGAFCCSSCHDVIDGRVKVSGLFKTEIELMHRQGVQRTNQYWLDVGLVVLK